MSTIKRTSRTKGLSLSRTIGTARRSAAKSKKPQSLIKGTVLSKSQQFEEIKKCGMDPKYFIKKYIKISHPTKGLVKFELFPYQEDCLDAFIEHKKIIVNKSRQLGLSTLSAAYSLWMALFHRERNVLVIATKLDVAKNFIRKVRANLSGLPEWLVLPKIVGDSTKYVMFSNGSQIKAIATSADSARSESLSLCIVDEAAHIEGIEEMWLGIQPTLSCLVGNTKVFTNKGIFEIQDFHKNRKVGEYFEIKEKDLLIYGKSGLEELSHGYVSPESKTYILTTRKGYSIEATLKHPLWVLNESGGKMVQTQDIKIGDCLRIQNNMQCFGENKLDKDIAYILGGYVAEGNCVWNTDRQHKKIQINGIQITNGDDDFKKVYLNEAKKYFGKNFHVIKSNNLKMYLYDRVKCKEFFDEVGLDPKSKCYEKITPKKILTSDRETVTNYLSGLFDGDGSVNGTISLWSTSKQLIQETQLLLSNMGFHPVILYSSGTKRLAKEIANQRLLPQKKVCKSLRDGWSVHVLRSEYRKFHDEIGFRISRKQNKLKNLSDKYIQDNRKLSCVPTDLIKDNIKNIIKLTGKSAGWYRENGLRIDKFLMDNNVKERQVNTTWIKNLRNLIALAGHKETESEQVLFDNLVGDFFFDPVVKIEESTNRTYDFTVPSTHTFIQNGILGSNTGGSAVLISSPSGVGTLFHKLWVDATANKDEKQEGINGFYGIELPWTVHPERDQKWFEQQRAEIIAAKGERGVGMELLCSFASSGDTFIKGDAMDTLFNNIRHPENIQPYNRDEIWIWKPPEPGHRYILASDVARGDGDDFSAFNIINIDTAEVVADFKGKPPPDKFAELMMTYGNVYNTALICQELNNVGIAAAIKLKDSKYPNLYYEKLMKNMFMKINPNDVGDELPGFTTNPNTRVEILAKLENLIRNNQIRLSSKRLFEELQTFIWKGNKPQAQKGYHDDLTMSLAIGCHLFEVASTQGTNKYDAIEEAMAMLKGMSRNTTTLNSATGQQKTNISQYSVVKMGPLTQQVNDLINNPDNGNIPSEESNNNQNNKPKRDYSRFGAFKWLMED